MDCVREGIEVVSRGDDRQAGEDPLGNERVKQPVEKSQRVAVARPDLGVLRQPAELIDRRVLIVADLYRVKLI